MTNNTGDYVIEMCDTNGWYKWVSILVSRKDTFADIYKQSVFGDRRSEWLYTWVHKTILRTIGFGDRRSERLYTWVYNTIMRAISFGNRRSEWCYTWIYKNIMRAIGFGDRRHEWFYTWLYKNVTRRQIGDDRFVHIAKREKMDYIQEYIKLFCDGQSLHTKL